MVEPVIQISTINIPLPAANTEYIWQLPKNLRWFRLQCRASTDLRISTQSDCVASSAAPYYTLKSGTDWPGNDMDIQKDVFLYFATGSTGQVVEILVGLKEEEKFPPHVRREGV